MSLAQASAKASITWQLQQTNGLFQPTTQGVDSRAVAFAIPAGVTSVYAAHLSLAAAANQDVALNSFTDLAGNAITATKVFGIIVVPDIGLTNATGVCTVKTSVTHGLTGWIFNSTGYAISGGGGGGLFQVQTTPVVVSGTVNSLNFSNSGGGTLTVDVVVLVGA